MPRAHAGNVELYYEIRGRGTPLVLVHGFACGIRSWDPQVSALSSAHRVITYDVRGHGISDAPRDAAAYSQATSIADLHALLRSLKIKRAIVGGLSMGGNIALNFTLAYPEMVEALIVADTGAGSDDATDWIGTVHDLARTLDQRGVEAFADAACALDLFGRYIAQGPEAERFIRSCLMTHRAHGLAHTGREVLCKRPSIYALESKLRALTVPTLLIVGEHDAPCTRVHDFMARTIPHAKGAMIRGAGHLTNLEAPAAFNAAVKRFLRSV